MIYDTYVPAYFKMDKRDYEIRRRRWREWRQKWIKRMGLAARPKRKVMPWHEQDEEDEDGRGGGGLPWRRSGGRLRRRVQGRARRRPR